MTQQQTKLDTWHQ